MENSKTDPGRQRERLLARLAAVLACPSCKVPLRERPGDRPGVLACPSCGVEGRRSGGQFTFGGFSREEVHADWLNRLKEAAKRRLGHFYSLASRLLSPVYATRFLRSFLATFDTDRDLVVDLGAGTRDHDQRVVCADGVAYPSVHLVADLERLAIQSDSVAGVVSVAVLEHVADPPAHVREMRRILQPGGRVLCYIPFIQGYHASPHDYQRYTVSGIRQLFADFEVLDVRVGAGPTSGLLWVLQEWLAIAFSFGSLRLYRLLMPATLLLFPLKYLDAVLVRHPAAPAIASGFVIEAQKPGAGE